MLSPTIVLVLRLGVLRPEALSSMADAGQKIMQVLDSDFASILQDGPTPIYSKTVDADNFAQHRLSSAAKSDQFQFKVTKLTSTQTFSMNKVFLENVRDTGALTFTSKRRALSTLRQYLLHPTSWSWNDVHHTRPKYTKLVSILSAESIETDQPKTSASPNSKSPPPSVETSDDPNNVAVKISGLQLSDKAKGKSKATGTQASSAVQNVPDDMSSSDLKRDFGMKRGFLNNSKKSHANTSSGSSA
ncbi:hypothetical protein Hypma_000306 [Hypsizygus marmoreus]|uniref:Uncharacterized protein n=1 Tax=Hypsizygus marmoreus TaxID=39966 RepID=A0A369J938_HYPMA|nr:hypothetical protein Hypma_000306 [Hypsizygus marmoreus]